MGSLDFPCKRGTLQKPGLPLRAVASRLRQRRYPDLSPALQTKGSPCKSIFVFPFDRNFSGTADRMDSGLFLGAAVLGLYRFPVLFSRIYLPCFRSGYRIRGLSLDLSAVLASPKILVLRSRKNQTFRPDHPVSPVPSGLRGLPYLSEYRPGHHFLPVTDLRPAGLSGIFTEKTAQPLLITPPYFLITPSHADADISLLSPDHPGYDALIYLHPTLTAPALPMPD